MIPLLLALAVLTVHRNRVLWLTAACLSYVAAVFTLTRAAWLGVAIGTVVLAVGREGRPFRHVVALTVACAALVAGLVLQTAVRSSAPVGNRLASVVDPSSGSLVQRLYIWEHTITLVRAKPWLGWGLETLGEVFPYDRPALVKLFGVRPVIMDKAHNDVLQMAVSVGVPGALAYVAFWATVVLAAFRLWKREGDSARLLPAGWLAAIVGYLVQVQFSFSAVALAPIVWVLAGSAAGWEAARPGTE
jgi:putative inorganic carbon (HCO3(-)) transporter